MAAETTTRAPGAHIADPGALGLGAFALTTFVLSVFNAGLLSSDAEPVVFGVALAFGGLVQLCAGMWEFTKGNTFGATAFSAYGGFWLSFWWLQSFTDFGDISEADKSEGVGIYLLAWSIFTLYMLVASLRTNSAIFGVFCLLTVTFFLLAIGDLAQADAVGTIGGWFGIATAFAAWYGSFAVVANATFDKTVLPVGPRS